MEALIDSLTDLGSSAFRWSAIALLVVNGIAGLGVALTRDRRLVNRWTSPWLALNLLLLGTGVGVPALAYSMRAVVNAVATTSPAEASITIDDRTP